MRVRACVPARLRALLSRQAAAELTEVPDMRPVLLEEALPALIRLYAPPGAGPGTGPGAGPGLSGANDGRDRDAAEGGAEACGGDAARCLCNLVRDGRLSLDKRLVGLALLRVSVFAGLWVRVWVFRCPHV